MGKIIRAKQKNSLKVELVIKLQRRTPLIVELNMEGYTSGGGGGKLKSSSKEGISETKNTWIGRLK